MTETEKGNFKRHGARVYFHPDGVILIKQTVKKDDQYIIDSDEGGHKEAFADIGSGQAERVLEILRKASGGELVSRSAL